MTQTVPNLHKNKRENGDNVGLVQHSKAPCGPFGTWMSAHILCVDLWNKITNSFTVAYCSTAHNLTILDSNQSKSREKASSLKRFLHSYVQSLWTTALLDANIHWYKMIQHQLMADGWGVQFQIQWDRIGSNALLWARMASEQTESMHKEHTKWMTMTIWTWRCTWFSPRIMLHDNQNLN